MFQLELHPRESGYASPSHGSLCGEKPCDIELCENRHYQSFLLNRFVQMCPIRIRKWYVLLHQNQLNQYWTVLFPMVTTQPDHVESLFHFDVMVDAMGIFSGVVYREEDSRIRGNQHVLILGWNMPPELMDSLPWIKILRLETKPHVTVVTQTFSA